MTPPVTYIFSHKFTDTCVSCISESPTTYDYTQNLSDFTDIHYYDLIKSPQ